MAPRGNYAFTLVRERGSVCIFISFCTFENHTEGTDHENITKVMLRHFFVLLKRNNSHGRAAVIVTEDGPKYKK